MICTDLFVAVNIVLDLKMMFEPRQLIEFKKPPEPRILPPYTGIAQYTALFEKTPPPPPTHIETPGERKADLKERLATVNKAKNEVLAADYAPHKNPKATE